jgi:uncharacterized membrane protein
MPKLFFIEAVVLNSWIVQLLWLMAIVASLLLFLLFLLNWFGINQDRHLYSAKQRAFGDPLAVLIFFTFLGWTSILSSLWVKHPEYILFYAVPASVVAAFFSPVSVVSPAQGTAKKRVRPRIPAQKHRRGFAKHPAQSNRKRKGTS